MPLSTISFNQDMKKIRERSNSDSTMPYHLFTKPSNTLNKLKLKAETSQTTLNDKEKKKDQTKINLNNNGQTLKLNHQFLNQIKANKLDSFIMLNTRISNASALGRNKCGISKQTSINKTISERTKFLFSSQHTKNINSSSQEYDQFSFEYNNLPIINEECIDKSNEHINKIKVFKNRNFFVKKQVNNSLENHFNNYLYPKISENLGKVYVS